ncbi:hypothetical protein ACSSS7_006677 [Eimeria intestinalis]
MLSLGSLIHGGSLHLVVACLLRQGNAASVAEGRTQIVSLHHFKDIGQPTTPDASFVYMQFRTPPSGPQLLSRAILILLCFVSAAANVFTSAWRVGDPAASDRSSHDEEYSVDDSRTFAEQAMVEVGKDMMVGLLDHEQVFAYSQSLQLVFKKSSKFTHSSFFLKELYTTNPFLKYFALRNKDRIEIVDKLEKSAKGLTALLTRDKALAAEAVMADVALRHLYTRTEAAFARGSYSQHRKEVTAALREANAGGHAMDLILGAKSKSLFSWTQSLKKNPLATLVHVVEGAYYESFEGEGGVLGHDLKKSCFSFGYRVNTIMPYTALFPGGVFGSVLKSLARSFVFVFYPAFASFRGIFTLMIGLICKTRVVLAFRKIMQVLTNLTRLGVRGVRVLFRRFAVRSDPVAWPLVRDLLFSGSPKMITLLFQLYAVDVEDITKSGKRVSAALAAGSGAWNYADGLWVGATDFGQAFNEIVKSYQHRVDALARYCEHQAASASSVEEQQASLLEKLVADESANGETEGSTPWETASEKTPSPPTTEEYVDASEDPALKEALEAILPGAQMSQEEAQKRLSRSCKKNKNFLQSYRRKPERHVKQLVAQMVKILKYDYRFFAHYIGDMLSIFYEAAHALLNADVANVINEKVGADTLGEQIGKALMRSHKYHEVSMELGKSSIPRRMFREPWLRGAARRMAHGFFHSAAGFALYYATESQAGSQSKAAFRELKTGASNLRKAIKSLYRQFLESKIMIARLEGDASVKTVQQFLSKCNDKLGVPDPQVCGKVVTNEVDPEAFVLDALFALNVRMASPPDDITLMSQTDYGRVFAKWSETNPKKKDRQLAAKASDAALAGRAQGIEGGFRPSPLQTSCWFQVERDNIGTLQFPIVEAARGQAQTSVAMGPAAPATGVPVHVVRGRINYRNTREELKSIKNDPSAVRDVMVARFVYTQGRAAAELTRATTGVMLEGRLYTFPFNFSTMKSILLGAVNRMIQRLHSLDSKDMVSVFLITVGLLAYHRIQKHRTGKTLVMNMYIRDTLYLRETERLGRFEEEFPYCGWIREHTQDTEELIVKCAAYRFLKIGDLNETEPHSREIRDYLDAFLGILNDVRGSTSWWDFLNVRIFQTEAEIYAKTTAKYSYLDLEEGLRAEQAKRGEESLTAAIHSDIHPALGGPQPYVKDRKALVTALRSFAENIKKLPPSLRKRLPNYITALFGKLRRLVGAKQFKWMQAIRPNVLHASTFYAAIQAAESLVFPSPYMDRGVFIDVLDLIEYARLQLSFEELAITLDSSRAMQTIASEMRTMPVQTAEAKDAYDKLKKKVDSLPLRTVEAAAGWSLRFLGEGQGGMDQALGLLALKSTEPDKVTRALQLTFAGVEVLNFLISALDVAQVLEFLGEATQDDLKKLRMSKIRSQHQLSDKNNQEWRVTLQHLDVVYEMETFSAALQTEARSFGLNIKSKYSLTQSIDNVAFVLEQLRVPVQECETLLTTVPPAFVRGSFDSQNTTEPAALCYFFLELSKRLSQQGKTFAPDALLQNLVVDGTSVMRFLKQIVDTSLSVEVRLASIKRITVMLRALLIACSTHQLGTIGAAQFTALDLKTGIMTFFFTNAVELQTGGPSRLKPAELFSQVARVVFGAATLEEQPQGSRIASASVSCKPDAKRKFEAVTAICSHTHNLSSCMPYCLLLYLVMALCTDPPSLEDWAMYIDQDRLEALMESVRQGSQPLTGEALAHVSASTRMADITDALFTMRLASPVEPKHIVRIAKQRIVEESSLKTLDKIGTAVMLSDLVKLVERTKIECLQKAMDDIETYLPLSLMERHLYNYDCFVKKVSDGMALISVARSLTDAFVAQLIEHINRAYTLKAEELLDTLKSKPEKLAAAVQSGGSFLKQVPNLALAYPVVREVITAVIGGTPWEDLLSSLRRLQQMDWALSEPTPLRKRLLDSVTRPNFFNPLQIATDCLSFLITGVYERPRMPKMLLFKRIKARAKMSWKRLRRQRHEDAVREAIAQRLAEEVSTVETLAGWARGEQTPSTEAPSSEKGALQSEEIEPSIEEGAFGDPAKPDSTSAQGEGESVPGEEALEEGLFGTEEPTEKPLLEGAEKKFTEGGDEEVRAESEGSTRDGTEDEFFDAAEG